MFPSIIKAALFAGGVFLLSSPVAAAANTTTTTGAAHQAFITSVGAAAYQAELDTGVPASVTIAQAILESGWGQSVLSSEANNFFGMKAVDTTLSGVIWLATTEYDASGQPDEVSAAFRMYPTPVDSLLDHDEMLASNKRYGSAMAVSSDAREFAARLADDGYATDPDYASKLIALMDQYDLYQFDG